MGQPQVISNISIQYKDDEIAKQRFVNHLLDLLLENEIDYLGGADLNSHERDFKIH